MSGARIAVALGAGLIFGAGLSLSDMIDPARVRAFLDIGGGAWDPTLAFVMAGAMAPMAVAWRLAARRAGPSLGSAFPARPTAGIDARLIGGAAMFGAGWGLVGFCPGPALAALGLGGAPALIFTAAMVTGMALEARIRPGPRAADA